MKNLLKLFVIIAMVAVIGLTMVGCGDGCRGRCGMSVDDICADGCEGTRSGCTC